MNARLDDQFEDASILNLLFARIAGKALKPANLAWTVGGCLAVGFVFSNALFFQDGVHPAAMFETRSTAQQNNLRDDELSAQVPVRKPVDSQQVTRIVLNENSNRTTTNRPVTAPLPSETANIEQEVQISAAIDPKKDDLRELQSLLAQLGHYKGEVDGLSGPKTRAAIEAYKSNVGLRGIELTAAELVTSARNNLIVTAAIPTTRPAVPQAIPQRRVETVSYTPPMRGDTEPPQAAPLDNDIAKVQAGLRAFGNTLVTVDGKLGPQTVNAIREFQALFKLEPTGNIDEQLMKKMSDVGLIN